jgi:hypothetical protein
MRHQPYLLTVYSDFNSKNDLNLPYVSLVRELQDAVGIYLNLHPMALRSLKNLDLPQDTFPFVSSLNLPSSATNSHLSKIFLYVIKPSYLGPANTPASFRFAHIQFLNDPVF